MSDTEQKIDAEHKEYQRTNRAHGFKIWGKGDPNKQITEIDGIN